MQDYENGLISQIKSLQASDQDKENEATSFMRLNKQAELQILALNEEVNRRNEEIERKQEQINTLSSQIVALNQRLEL